MEAYQQRVVDEHKELSDRRAKLGDFLRSKAYANLSGVQQDLLERQHKAMLAYEGILDERIALFPK